MAVPVTPYLVRCGKWGLFCYGVEMSQLLVMDRSQVESWRGRGSLQDAREVSRVRNSDIRFV